MSKYACVCFLLIGAVFAQFSRRQFSEGNSRISNTKSVPFKAITPFEKCGTDIGSLVNELANSDQARAEAARASLETLARESSECSMEIISTVANRMNQSDNVAEDPGTLAIWTEGGQLFAQLQSIKGLDLLVDHLDVDNLTLSASMRGRPAMLGAMAYGKSAEPKLVSALRQSPKASIRSAAAFCIYAISGAGSKQELKSALDTESDYCVRNFIFNALYVLETDTSATHKMSAKDVHLLTDAKYHAYRSSYCAQ